jgi:hypothetical protein
MTTETPGNNREGATSVHQAVTKQYRQESRGLKYEQDFQLKQKYGLVTPQLTGAENNIIRREVRSGRS